MNKKGFTLVELLTVVIITGILAAMAVPMYEKAMERSRLAEVRTQLAKLLDAKLRAMDDWNISTYNNDFGVDKLEIGLACGKGGTACSGTKFSTEDFTYTLKPTGTAGATFLEASTTGVSKNIANGVCATRKKGDNKGVAFLYLGELTSEQGKRFQCNNGGVTDGCASYGMTSTGSAWCSN